MRFSLGTLVLFILLISSVITILVQGDRWYVANIRPLGAKEVFDGYNISPSRKLRLGSMQEILNPGTGAPSRTGYDSVGIFENTPGGKLLFPLTTKFAVYASFKSESEIWILDEGDSENASLRVTIFKRRYEDSLFAYVTRPEFLIMLVTSGLLIYRLISTIRRKMIKDPVA